MFKHNGSGLLKSFDFQNSGRAPDGIGRFGLAEDQAFPAQRFDLGQFCPQMLFVLADFVFDDGHIAVGMLLKPLAGKGQTLLKAALGLWRIKDHIPDRLPAVMRRLTSNNADGLGESLPPDP